MEHILDLTGLTYLWGKIKNLFATKAELAGHPTGRIYYGTCSTTANTYIKEATVETFPLDEDDKPLVGTVVAIKYSVSNTYKTEGQTYALNVNNTGAYPMYYNNAAVATSTSANTLVAGYKNRHVFYVFNGTQWVWLSASYDANTTYSGMTQAEVDAGTGTTARLITPARLRDNFYTEDEVDGLLGSVVENLDTSSASAYTSIVKGGNESNNTSYLQLDNTQAALKSSAASVSVSNSGVDISAGNSGYPNATVTINGAGVVPTTRKVNGKALSADVTLSASDVDALPSNTAIPTKVSDLTNDSGFTTNTGTITGITMNGASKGTSGVVNLGTVITSETALSKGTTSGSGNAVTDISVSGHQITLTKGSTFLTSHQDISGKADKSEMSVVAGTGANADKTTITLKSGTSATVLTSHQDISGKANVSALAGYTPTANFATINGASITGGGDVIITAGSSSITTIDAVPTKNSTNPVQSGGVYDAIEGGFYY